jgi:hypothetical protein
MAIIAIGTRGSADFWPIYMPELARHRADIMRKPTVRAVAPALEIVPAHCTRPCRRLCRTIKYNTDHANSKNVWTLQHHHW